MEEEKEYDLIHTEKNPPSICKSKYMCECVMRGQKNESNDLVQD